MRHGIFTNMETGMSSHLGELQGTPWHIDFVRKSENDPRRHRSRCSHYQTDKSCSIYGICIGSSHCKFYSDIALENERKRSRTREKTWKVSARHDLFPNLVQLGDKIILYSLEEDDNITVKIKDKTENMPKIQHECLGKGLGDYFSFAEFLYQIISIQKPDGSISKLDNSSINKSKREFSKKHQADKSILNDMSRDSFPDEKTYFEFIKLLNCLSQHTKNAIVQKKQSIVDDRFKMECQNVILYLQKTYNSLQSIDKSLNTKHFDINDAMKFINKVDENNTNKHLLKVMMDLFRDK